MPNIKDQSTVNAIAREFTSNGRNKEQTLLTVGYSKQYARSGDSAQIYSNPAIIEAIAKIDEEKTVKYEHDEEIAISLLRADYSRLAPAAEQGNIQAIQARTAIVRELSSTMGLHSQTIRQEPAPATVPEQEQAAYDKAAETYKLSLVKDLERKQA